MGDEAGKASARSDSWSNSGSMHREPPPSLGMVAHIWAGHLGAGEPDPRAAAEMEPEPVSGSLPAGSVITLPSPEPAPTSVD